MYYSKIATLWKRDPANNFVIMPGKYSCEEFTNVKKWNFTEKIDGMNMQVNYKEEHLYYGPIVTFQGRTPKAKIPPELFSFMQRAFEMEKMEQKFEGAKEVTLFGEGYGAGIQKGGGLYQQAKEFILFDAIIDDTWLSRSSVENIAAYFDVKCVPEIKGITTINDAITYVKWGPYSLVAEAVRHMEGIVARSDPMMLFRNGNPLMWKLKLADCDRLGKEEQLEKEN